MPENKQVLSYAQKIDIMALAVRLIDTGASASVSDAYKLMIMLLKET